MALLVDSLKSYSHRPLGHEEWCHLVSDTSLDELHEFASRLGLPVRAFQGDHYDLTRELREDAVRLGAVEVTSRQLVGRMVRVPNRGRP